MSNQCAKWSLTIHLNIYHGCDPKKVIDRTIVDVIKMVIVINGYPFKGEGDVPSE